VIGPTRRSFRCALLLDPPVACRRSLCSPLTDDDRVSPCLQSNPGISSPDRGLRRAVPVNKPAGHGHRVFLGLRTRHPTCACSALGDGPSAQMIGEHHGGHSQRGTSTRRTTVGCADSRGTVREDRTHLDDAHHRLAPPAYLGVEMSAQRIPAWLSRPCLGSSRPPEDPALCEVRRPKPIRYLCRAGCHLTLSLCDTAGRRRRARFTRDGFGRLRMWGGHPVPPLCEGRGASAGEVGQGHDDNVTADQHGRRTNGLLLPQVPGRIRAHGLMPCDGDPS